MTAELTSASPDFLLRRLTQEARTTPHTTLEAHLRVLQAATGPVQAALAARVLNVLAQVIAEVDPAVLGDAAGAHSDYEVLLCLLEYPEVAAVLRTHDALAPARLRWLRGREHLLQAEGGAIPVDEVASLLHMTRQGVDKRRRAGTLIGLSQGRRGYLYPVWQFQQGGVLPGLDRVLAVLRDKGYDGWDQVAYLLSGDPRLDGQTPLEAVRRGQVQEAVEAAQSYGQQGGA